MKHTIISVTVENRKVDVEVHGSELSIDDYGHAISAIVRTVASLFAKAADLPVEQDKVVERIMMVIDSEARTSGEFGEIARLQ